MSIDFSKRTIFCDIPKWNRTIEDQQYGTKGVIFIWYQAYMGRGRQNGLDSFKKS
jgi:hypothetical protein